MSIGDLLTGGSFSTLLNTALTTDSKQYTHVHVYCHFNAMILFVCVCVFVHV